MPKDPYTVCLFLKRWQGTGERWNEALGRREKSLNVGFD